MHANVTAALVESNLSNHERVIVVLPHATTREIAIDFIYGLMRSGRLDFPSLRDVTGPYVLEPLDLFDHTILDITLSNAAPSEILTYARKHAHAFQLIRDRW